MTSEKPERTASSSAKKGCDRPEASLEKLADDFLAKLNRSWRQHGPEALTRLSTERPELYVKAIVELAVAQLGGCAKLSDSDRRLNREQALHRLEQHAQSVVSKPFPKRAFRRADCPTWSRPQSGPPWPAGRPLRARSAAEGGTITLVCLGNDGFSECPTFCQPIVVNAFLQYLHSCHFQG